MKNELIVMENYENLISYLKMILEFYADPNTYINDYIIKDQGFMAKTGLDEIEKIKKYNEELEDLSNKLDNQEITEEDIKNKLNNFLNLNKNENIH